MSSMESSIIDLKFLNSTLDNDESVRSVEIWLKEHVVPFWNREKIVYVDHLPTTSLTIKELNRDILIPREMELCAEPLPFFMALESFLFPAKFKRRNFNRKYFVVPCEYEDDE